MKIFGLKNYPKEDVLCVFNKMQNNFLFITSWLSLLSFIYAHKRGHYDLMWVPFAVWFSSILYWWHPVDSIRRYFDITVVSCGLTFQLYKALHAEYNKLYYFFVLMAVLCYPLSQFYYLSNPWISVFCHSLIHILGNVSNFILYSGYIHPL
jgi:hypothetical protein